MATGDDVDRRVALITGITGQVSWLIYVLNLKLCKALIAFFE